MNDVRLHVPYIFGNKQNSKIRDRQKRNRRDREEKQKEERPAVGQEKQERGKAKAQ